MPALDENETDRKAQPRQRRESESQLRYVVDNGPFILWAVDAEGLFTLAEGQGLAGLGQEPGAAVGISAFERYRDYPEVQVALRRGLAGEAFSYTVEVKGRTYETRTFPLRDAAGKLAGFSAVSLDITERQQAEAERSRMREQLLDAQRLESLGLLAGGIAHDFNNILTIILGSAYSASFAIPPGDPAQADIQSVITASERAADLTRQMLAYAGRGNFEASPIELSAHVGEIAKLLEMTVSRKVQLRLELEPDLPLILAGAAQLQQVVMNLVLNGAEAIGDAVGTVRVTTGVQVLDASSVASSFPSAELAPGRYAFVEVCDTGVGMDAATQAKIFDPFFTTKFTGRGLGLSAVLGIMRAHKGGIRVCSSPGAGSTFTAFFPSCDVEATEGEAAQAMYRAEGLALLVDDDEGVRRVTRNLLTGFGLSVIEAVDGRQGAQLLAERAADVAVVILDMTMPEMSGEEAFREIRRHSQVPVLLMSGFTQVEIAKRFSAHDRTSFLQKPFTPSELSDALRLLLEEEVLA